MLYIDGGKLHILPGIVLVCDLEELYPLNLQSLVWNTQIYFFFLSIKFSSCPFWQSKGEH